MSTPTIPAGNLFMNATLYSGINATLTITNGITGQAMQPDFLWVKRRDTSGSHLLWDSVRGVTLGLNSDRAAAEQTATGGTGLASFNSNGFTLGGDFSGTGSSNTNGATYVGWQWKANGTAVSNTAGTITSQVSANTTSGFSVVTFTGTGATGTVGHGLGVTPSFIIFKIRTAAYCWSTYFTGMTVNQYLLLNTTGSTATFSGQWNTLPTSTVFGVGSGDLGSNQSGAPIVAYCWAPIAGYSAFGSYTGNGSTDGPFVYLGFRPRWVMIKRTDTTSNWYIIDTSRSTYNVMINVLSPNLSDAEDTGSTYADCLSNGFKIRTSAVSNASGGTYIYAAFAENPFKYANAR